MEHRSPAYVAVLAVIAGSILLVGSLMRPAKPVEQDSAPPSRVEMMRLQRLTQRGSLEQTADFFSALASDVSSNLVRLDALGQTGLVWDAEGRVVTANRPGDPRAFGLLAGRTSEAKETRLTAGFTPPHLPVATLRADDQAGLAAPVHVPTRLLRFGQWVMAAWLAAGGETARAPGLYLGSRKRSCGDVAIDQVILTVEVTPEMAGGGVFDLDGRVLAVVVRCDDGFAAVAAESVDKLLEQAGTIEGQMLARYGLGLALLNEAQQIYFAVDNAVLVSDVWDGYLGDTVGLEPGDLIVSVDGAGVESPDDLQGLVLPIARELHSLEVRRGRRTLDIKLPARAAGALPAAEGTHSGALLAPATQGFLIGAVLKGSAAFRAGIRAGDRLVRIDQTRIRTETQARRALENGSGKQRYLVLARGSKRWGALLP